MSARGCVSEIGARLSAYGPPYSPTNPGKATQAPIVTSVLATLFPGFLLRLFLEGASWEEGKGDDEADSKTHAETSLIGSI